MNRSAVSRAHVLIVEVPGSWLGRVRLEAMMAQRGWQRALSPADADVLAVCGVPDGELDDAVQRIWEQMPGPRVRIDTTAAQRDVHGVLEAAARELGETEQHREDARTRTAEPHVGGAHDGEADGHGDMDHGDMNHGDMDHGDMEMAPDGIPLAEGARGRDGLEMDVLHVRLGPVLAHWPAGLVIETALQGDLIVEASGWWVGTLSDPAAEVAAESWCMGLSDADLDRVWRWDNLVHLLVLVGWQDAAERAHACRTAMVQAGAPSGVDERAAALVRRIARARSLRWSLRGVGPISAETCKRIGLPPSVAGDSYTRLRRMMDRCLEPQLGSKGGQSEERSLDVAAMPSVLVGVDLAVARVVLASLNLRPARVAAKDAPDA